jgi:hypothetical protein
VVRDMTLRERRDLAAGDCRIVNYGHAIDNWLRARSGSRSIQVSQYVCGVRQGLVHQLERARRRRTKPHVRVTCRCPMTSRGPPATVMRSCRWLGMQRDRQRYRWRKPAADRADPGRRPAAWRCECTGISATSLQVCEAAASVKMEGVGGGGLVGAKRPLAPVGVVAGAGNQFLSTLRGLRSDAASTRCEINQKAARTGLGGTREPSPGIAGHAP